MGKFTNIVSAQITGNVGSMNFRRKDGDIIAAQRATTNSSKGDGASYAQRLHRIRIANIANIYRAIALIEKRGWENKGANQSDFNMFSKFNLANSPVFLTKQEAELGAAVVAPYAVSRGSLVPIECKYVEETVFQFGLKLGSAEIDWDTMTIPDFSARIIENNKGWQYGDKLSACVCHQITRTVSGVTIPQVEVVYLEITLDADSTQLLTDMGNWDALQIDADNDHVLRFLDGGDAAFIIHSREVAGKLLTSEQDMILQNPYGELYRKYTSDAQRDAAMQSYGYKDAVLLDPNSENSSAAGAVFSIESIGVGTSLPLTPVSDGSELSIAIPTAFQVRGANLESGDFKLFFVSNPGQAYESEEEIDPNTINSQVATWMIEDAGNYRLKAGDEVIANFAIVEP